MRTQKYIISALLCLILGGEVWGQCLSLPDAFEQKLESAEKILEGRVVGQQSFFGDDGNIYTSNEVEVYRVFKGDVGFESTIVTEGGIVGDLMQVVTPSVQLNVGDYGIFTSLDNKTTEFVALDESSTAVYGNHRFNHREALYESIARNVGSNTIEMRRIPLDSFQAELKGSRSTPELSMVSPSMVTAGTRTILTIEGSGFGNEQGSGHVAFSNADDGGQSFVALQPGPHYLSWTDTEIQLYVPSATLYNATVAGTGQIKVRNDQGMSGLSDQEVTVKYAKSEVVYNQNLNSTHLVGMNSGGYEFSINQELHAFLGGDAIVRSAFEKWACNTGVNFILSEDVVSVVDWSHDDINLMGLSTSGQLPSYLLGKTITTFSGCGTPNGLRWNLIEVDVLLNSDIDWWIGEGTPMSHQFDMATSILHEIGHAQLLQHNNDPASPMYFELTEGATRRNLNQITDIDGGTYIANEAIHAEHTCSAELHELYDDSNCNLSLINSVMEEDNQQFEVFPNPFNDEFSVVLEGNSPAAISVFDAQGRSVLEDNWRGSKVVLRTDGLPSGMYLLVVTAEEGRFARRLVKN